MKVTITGHSIENNKVYYTTRFEPKDLDYFQCSFDFPELLRLNNNIINSKQINLTKLPVFPKKCMSIGSILLF